MFLRFFLFLVLSISTTAFGADTAAEILTQKQLDVMESLATKAVTAANVEQKAYEDSIKGYGSLISRFAGSTWSSTANGASNLITKIRSSMSSGLAVGEDASAAIDAASLKEQATNNAEADKAWARTSAAKQKASEKLDVALAATKTSFEAAATAVSNAASVTDGVIFTKQKEMALNTRLSAFGLQSDMASLTAVFKDINEAKTLLERKLDKSIMASYMQSKMTKLLNSDVFCAAASAKSCKNGKSISTFSTGDLKSIFPVDATSTTSKTPSAKDMNAKSRN